MATLPSLSIVVPNYQGGATIGRTLECLLDQKYPGLEILVIDGGSTDNSVQVIRQYEKHLAYWVSEKDRGQSHAINKGFARCQGEIVNWLCSDDRLTDGALLKVGQVFADDPTADVVAGAGIFIYEKEGREYAPPLTLTPTLERISLIPCCNPIIQPSCYYRRKLLARPLPVTEDYHYAMDMELWAWFVSRKAQWHCLTDVLSINVNDGRNKSSVGGMKFAKEMARLYRTYHPKERISLMFWQEHLRNPLHVYVSKHPRRWQTWRLRLWLERLDRWLGRYYGPDRVKALDWRWCTMK